MLCGLLPANITVFSLRSRQIFCPADRTRTGTWFWANGSTVASNRFWSRLRNLKIFIILIFNLYGNFSLLWASNLPSVSTRPMLLIGVGRFWVQTGAPVFLDRESIFFQGWFLVCKKKEKQKKKTRTLELKPHEQFIIMIMITLRFSCLGSI